MTGPGAPLSSEVAAKLVLAIEFHGNAARACNGQARELFELERRAVAGEGPASEPDRVVAGVVSSIQRAVHELEAALHCSALTSIGLGLASLEAQGFEIRGLLAVHDNAEAAARRPFARGG